MLQTASSPVQISVIADDQDHMVPLLNAIYDPTATRSVISRVKANDTLGNIREGSAVGVISSAKVDAVTTSYITLRWRYEHGLQSFQEVFHVVDGSEMNGLDAVLRGDIEATPAQVARPVANPMFYGQTGRAGKDERKVREQEMKKKEEAFKKNVAEQRKVVRTTLDGAKGAVRR